jgi:hypothetical protein
VTVTRPTTVHQTSSGCRDPELMLDSWLESKRGQSHASSLPLHTAFVKPHKSMADANRSIGRKADHSGSRLVWRGTQAERRLCLETPH